MEILTDCVFHIVRYIRLKQLVAKEKTWFGTWFYCLLDGGRPECELELIVGKGWV